YTRSIHLYIVVNYTPSSPTLLFSLLIRLPPTSTLFPYTTLFRSRAQLVPGRERWFLPHGRRHDKAAAGREREESHRERPRLIVRSEEHTSELQSRVDLVCRLLLEKKKKNTIGERR